MSNSVACRADIYDLWKGKHINNPHTQSGCVRHINSFKGGLGILAGGGVVAIWSNMFESLFKPQQVGRNRYCAAVKYVKLQHNCGASLAGSLSSILEYRNIAIDTSQRPMSDASARRILKREGCQEQPVKCG